MMWLSVGRTLHGSRIKLEKWSVFFKQRRNWTASKLKLPCDIFILPRFFFLEVWQWFIFNIISWVFILKMVISSLYFGVRKSNAILKASLQKPPPNHNPVSSFSFFHLESSELCWTVLRKTLEEYLCLGEKSRSEFNNLVPASLLRRVKLQYYRTMHFTWTMKCYSLWSSWWFCSYDSKSSILFKRWQACARSFQRQKEGPVIWTK